MSIIAWDGTWMAADSLGIRGGAKVQTRKLFREGNFVIGFAGRMDFGMALIEWIVGRQPDFPKWQDRDDYTAAIFTRADRPGTLYVIDQTPYPYELTVPFFAIGSGREFALAAMHLGHSASEAVRVACELSAECDLPIKLERCS